MRRIEIPRTPPATEPPMLRIFTNPARLKIVINVNRIKGMIVANAQADLNFVLKSKRKVSWRARFRARKAVNIVSIPRIVTVFPNEIVAICSTFVP